MPLSAPATLLLVFLGAADSLPGLEPDPHFLENGILRLGVDKSSGASIFFLGETKTGRNVLNHADRGRFIQQSYYGAPDGSLWNGKPWRWNPVQGGNWMGKPSVLEAFEATPNSLYARTIPHPWAGSELITTARMEQWIELEGAVARLRFRFRYNGETDHPPHHQELPAVFMDHALPNLIFYSGDKPWTDGPLTRVVPGWPNETQNSTENWAAYLDADDWGCGVYFPGTTLLTTYRHSGPAGPEGGGCSYFAPIRTMAITKGLDFEYVTYLTLGTLAEIRQRFDRIHRRPAAGVPDAPAKP